MTIVTQYLPLAYLIIISILLALIPITIYHLINKCINYKFINQQRIIKLQKFSDQLIRSKPSLKFPELDPTHSEISDHLMLIAILFIGLASWLTLLLPGALMWSELDLNNKLLLASAIFMFFIGFLYQRKARDFN